MEKSDSRSRRREKRGGASSPSEFGVILDSVLDETPPNSRRRRRRRRRTHGRGRGPRQEGSQRRRAPAGIKEENFPSPSHFGPMPTVRTRLAGNGRLETAGRVFGWMDEEGAVLDPKYEAYTPEQVKLETLRRMQLFMSSAMLLFHHTGLDDSELNDELLESDPRLHTACDMFGWLDEEGNLIPKYATRTPEQIKSETMRQMETVISSAMLLYLHSTKTDEVRRASEGELESMWALHSWKTSAMKNEFAVRAANERIALLENVLNTVYVKENDRLSSKAKKLIVKTLPGDAFKDTPFKGDSREEEEEDGDDSEEEHMPRDESDESENQNSE